MATKDILSKFTGEFNPTKNSNDPILRNSIFGQVFNSGVWNNQKSSVSGQIIFIEAKRQVVKGATICTVDFPDIAIAAVSKKKKAAPKKKKTAKKKVVKKKVTPKKKAVPKKKGR